MLKYLFWRLSGLLLTLLGLSFVSFCLIELVPGDPVITMLGEAAAWQDIERLRIELGLNKPFLVRYYNWITNAVMHGDLGYSLLMNQPITELFKTRIPRTAWLALLSFLLTILIGIPSGILAALYAGGLIDRLVMTVSTVFLATPIFLVALFLMWIFAVRLRWFPVAGYIAPTSHFIKGIKSLCLPALSISTMYIAYIARMTRAAILETLTQDFVVAAQAKGVTRARLVFLHIMKPSLVPILTAGGLVLAELLGGTIVSETIFVIPGIGRLTFDAAVKKDVFVLQAMLLFMGSIYYVINVIVDISLAVIDPRMRII
jgi:peptide/nickel transport system permease protein